jgi:hypothetical protein
VQEIIRNPVSRVTPEQNVGQGVEIRKYKSTMQRMWAGAKYRLVNPEAGGDVAADVREKHQWYKFQCYTVESLLRNVLTSEPRVEVTEVTVTLGSMSLVGSGFVVVALGGMAVERGLGFNTLQEIAGSQRFTLESIRNQVQSVTFRVTEDLSGVVKPVGEVGKAPRVLIRVTATTDCIEQSATTLTYRVKVRAVAGSGPTQIVAPA